MADRSASLIINIVVNDAQAARAVRQIREQVGGLPPAAEAASAANNDLAESILGIAGAYGAWQAAVGAATIYKEAEAAAFNLEQSVAAANKQFKDVGSAESWGKTISDLSAELKIYSDSALESAASKTLDMTKRLGMSETQMQQVLIAAANLGSGKMALGDSIERVTAAMRGEAEGAEALGLTLGETYVQSWYKAKGAQEGAWSSLSDLQKAQVRYQVLLEQAAPVAGKAAASYDTMGGSIEAAKAQLNNLVADGFAPVGKAVGETIRWTLEAAEGNKELTIAIGVTGAAFVTATGFAVVYNSTLGATVAAQAAAAAGSLVAAAAIAAPYAIIAAGVTSVVLAVKSYGEMRDAQEQAAAAGKRAADQQDKYFARLDRASAAAGVELKSWQEVQAAYQAGILDYDKMTDTYSKGSGVARAAAEVHTEGAAAVGAAAAASRKSIEELDKENKILFSDAKKNYEEYAKGIKEVSAKITEIGLRPTDQGGGFADVKGALEDIAASGRVAGSTLVREFDEAGNQVAEYYAGLGGLKLGMSSVADELFELSQAGKTQEQVWKANQMAAAQYLQSAKELGAQAAEAARRGDDEGAKQLWDAEAAAIGKADALYRKLAVTVKTEWSPAMDEAHRKSTETITKFGGSADKALALARAGYDKVADAAKRSADAQQYFADKLRDVARESMTEAEAYEDIKRAAAEATAEAARLSKAGDWQGAQEQAKAAAEAWAQVPKEVKDGEQTLVSSAESAQVRADGIRQAAEISKAAYAAERQELEANAAAAQRNAEIIIAAEQAIVAATAAKLAALKEGNASAAAAADEEIAAAKARAEAAQEEVEAAAQKSGDSSGAQATQEQINKINELVKANEEAAAKIKALEEEKGKVISAESENAKIAAEGVVAAQQQLVDAYDERRQTLEGLAGVEVAIMESVAKATTSASAEIKAAAAAAKTELESIKASIDAIPSNKEVTITVREVQARFGGGAINARNMSGGARVSGPTGYDSVLAALAGDEFVINNKMTRAIGFGHFHFENTGQWDKALLSLAAFHGQAETARLLSGFLPQPEITMRPLPSFRQQEPSQPADFVSKIKNFGTINLQIGDVSVPAMVQVDHLAMFQREQEKQRQRIQRATGRRP
jgi:hypothetical protein